MPTVTITGPSVRDSTSLKDNRPWFAFAAEYQDGGDGGVVTPRKSKPIYPSKGIISFELEAGIAAWIQNPDGEKYLITVPDEDASLWGLISAAIAFPPDTSAERLASAVNQFLEDNPPAAGWSAITGKPAVIAAGSDAATARSVIGAGTSNLSLGTTGSTAKAGNYTPDWSEVSSKPAALAAGSTAAAARTAVNAAPFLAPGRFTAAGKSDGSLTTLDTGQAWSIFGNTPSAIVSGYVKHTPVGSSSSTASYAQAPTTSRPTRIICKGRWTGSDGNDNAALTIVVPISAWGPVGGFDPTNAAQVVAGIHSSFYRNGIHKHSRWNVGTQTIYGDSEAAAGSNPALGRYSTVPVNKVVKIELWVDYDTGTITFFPPQGGKPFTIQDDVIKTDCGNYVIWEQFEFNGTSAGSPFEILEMHFDTQARDTTAFHMAAPDVADLVPGLIAAAAPGVESTTASGATKTLTSDSPRFQAFVTGTTTHTVKLPPTLTSVQPWFINNAITNGQLTVQTSDGTTMIVLTAGQLLIALPYNLTPTAVGNWLYVPVASTIGTQTLSATRVNPRVTSTTTATSLTPSFATADIYKYTALASTLVINAPGNTTDGHRQRIWIKDDGTSRTLTWNAAYVAASGVTIPTSTTVGKWVMVEYEYNTTAAKAFVIRVTIEP